MSFLDTLKKLLKKAPQVAEDLGLDDKIVSVLEGLVEKLDGLQAEGKLDDIAQNALTSFKPALAAFQNSKELQALLEKAKTFVEGLASAELPDEVQGLVERVKGFIK